MDTSGSRKDASPSRKDTSEPPGGHPRGSSVIPLAAMLLYRYACRRILPPAEGKGGEIVSNRA